MPIFFQISIFLTYSKGGDFSYILRRKIPRLINLYLFWILIGFAIRFLILGKSYSFSFLRSPKGILLWFMQGGSRPELYFLFSLIFVTIIAGINQAFFKATSNSIKYQFILLLISSLLLYVYPVIPLLFFKKNILTQVLPHYWNPLNFLPYVFSSVIILYQLTEDSLNRFSTSWPSKGVIYLSIVFVLVSLSEWLWMKDLPNGQFLLPPYSRLSLVVGSSLVVYLCCGIKNRATGLIMLVSDYSLGIYCTHYNFIFPVNFFVRIYSGLLPSGLQSLANMLTFFSVLTISVFLVKYLRNIRIIKQFT